MNYALALITTVFILSACGSSDQSGNPGGPEGAFSSQAVWESSCLDSTEFALTMRSRFEIEGEAFRKITQYFSDGDCTNLSIESLEEGSLARTASSDGSPTGTIDFNYSTVSITPSQPGIQLLNVLSYCGSNDWQAGQLKDVTRSSGRTNCWYATPRTVRDIYSINGNDLYFGVGTDKQKSGSASANRS